MDYFRNLAEQTISCDVFTSGSGIMCDISRAHVTLNLKSCTAKLSQKPSMANLEAAYTSLNTTPTKKCTRFSFRWPTSDSFVHPSVAISCIHQAEAGVSVIYLSTVSRPLPHSPTPPSLPLKHLPLLTL